MASDVSGDRNGGLLYITLGGGAALPESTLPLVPNSPCTAPSEPHDILVDARGLRASLLRSASFQRFLSNAAYRPGTRRIAVVMGRCKGLPADAAPAPFPDLPCPVMLFRSVLRAFMWFNGIDSKEAA